MLQSSTPQEHPQNRWSKVPDWAQLILAVVTCGGLMLSNYVANEVARADIKKDVSRHTQDIAQLQAEVRGVPVLIEKVDQLHTQNERVLLVFDKFADSVDGLSINVARLEERMRALEKAGD